jgi:RNA polymerase sigma factor (sigma-70 family)
MLASAIPSLLQHIRRLAAAAPSDEQLLADYLARRSDEAFAAILGRHGPMVLNVCRRILHDAHAAEDVFQATFLVLADRADAIHRRASLAGFLHGVAYRLAVRARRRPTQSLPAAQCDNAAAPVEELAWKEVLGILDHELGQLSDQYRDPLVLCYLEGRTQDEAARQLGWSLSTLRRRLTQGRRVLEARLRGRGVSLPASLAGLLAAGDAAVSPALCSATLAAVGAQVGGLGAGSAVLPSARKGLGLLLTASARKVAVLVAVAILGVAVCCAAFWPAPADQAPASEPPPAAPAVGAGPTDPSADPLPAQGVARYGTARYHHGSRIESLSVSADGKLAAVATGFGWFTPTYGRMARCAQVFDLTDGRALYSLTDEAARDIEAVGMSPDGKILATRDEVFLHFRDAATGKELRKLNYLPESGGVSRSITEWLTFTPDSKQIAATLLGDAVQLIDVETLKVVRKFEFGGAATACVFSPDGKWMATGGYDLEEKVYHARLWEVSTGKELRRFPAAHFPAGNGVKRALAFSPDGALLAGGGWGDARLRIWETATGKEPITFPRLAEEVVAVAFAPDGKTVAVASDQIYLYDPTTGKERFRIERRAQRVAYSQDGAVLIGAVSGAIYRWDAATGRQLTPAAAQDSAVEQILVSADGRRLFTTDQEGDLHVWDVGGGKAPRRLAGGFERGVVASPDRKFLAGTIVDKFGNSHIRLYDIAGDRFVERFPVIGGRVTVAAFLPDGQSLLTLEAPATLRMWDVETGKERRSFAVVPPPSVGRDPGLPSAIIPFYTSRRITLSPDGKTLAIGPDFPENFRPEEGGVPVRLFDLQGNAGTGLADPRKALGVPDAAKVGKTKDTAQLRITRRIQSLDGRAFSPDGRFLVSWAEHPYERSSIDHVYVWDAATGRAVASLSGGGRPGAANAAFPPDGRTLATASADGTIRLWEVATWKLRAEFRGHRDRITALGFGPDGRLYTGGLDTTILAWDVQPPRDASKGTLGEAWEALTATDGKVGFQAQGRFLAEPDKAVEWFASRIPPASQPETARVKALIADLGTDDFDTRERATLEFAELGPFIADTLREVVEKATSAEARRRAEGLLREMEQGVIPPRELRSLRAVEILEWIATPEARARLLELAKGTPEARLTRAAAAASKMLEGRK